MASFAPGWPGIPGRWTSSAKECIGTAVGGPSRVWFTVSHGILNEIYWPRIDRACTRDVGLIVTDGVTFFSEEKRHARADVTPIAAGIPGCRVVSTCRDGRYRIEKTIVTDPSGDAVLQRTRLVPLVGELADYRLYVLAAPHLDNHGAGNTAWVGEHKGVPMLFAARDGHALALACSTGWRARSVGFVGASDGWQDLVRHRQLAWRYERAENGNVALTGEIDLTASAGGCALAIAFGRTADEAAHQALATLAGTPDGVERAFVSRWRNWQSTLLPLAPDGLYRASTAVLRTHEDKTFAGGLIASLSVPWGFAKGDDDLGGYHLVWPRDHVESAGALLACGAFVDAQRALRHLAASQEADGHWPQNEWLDGTPYWAGVQMDETAFPILLVDLADREGALRGDETAWLWPMVRRAAGYLARNGPVTDQDRWEEDPGYSPFTLAVEIAGLVVAADFADRMGEPALATYLRETADWWNAAVERWTYVRGTSLAKRVGVDGYYVRVTPPEEACAASPASGFVPIKNRPPGETRAAAVDVVSVDALALVRFGLRAANDPRIVDTVRVIDALLRTDTPRGPAWHRYNGDGYGEHDDGSPFDGTGIGRAWPLLVGERAHYELTAGRVEEARRLTTVLEAFASGTGLIPEQVWDSPDIPDRELFAGRPSGSAMPLVWAHAEHVKLLRSLRDGQVFDMPRAVSARYGRGRPAPGRTVWRFNHRCQTLAAGDVLRIEVLAPAIVHWSSDGWASTADAPTHDTGIGVHLAELPTSALPMGREVMFTLYWPDAGRWEGADFTVRVR